MDKIAGPWIIINETVWYCKRVADDGEEIAWVYCNPDRTKWGWSALLLDDNDRHGQTKTKREAQQAADKVLIANGWTLKTTLLDKIIGWFKWV